MSNVDTNTLRCAFTRDAEGVAHLVAVGEAIGDIPPEVWRECYVRDLPVEDIAAIAE